MVYQELTYWVTLAHIPKMWTKRKNELYVKCFEHEPKLSVIDLFEQESIWTELGLSDEEKRLFLEAKEELAGNAFLIEEMMNQGYQVLPLHSDDYPKLLKHNLKAGSPTVLYAKGNIKLLQEPSIAIVGSRNAEVASLDFTDKVAQKASEEGKVVVSGFAKGVDRQALDSALACDGRSIIVLPQGILTFSSGFRQYYKQIVQGNVLVVSFFHPNAPWSTGLAMARNPIIYGLASEIYVAQSDAKGGTWEGVKDGLKKGRSVFVRYPGLLEKNANRLLIDQGAKPVDVFGKPIDMLPDTVLSSEEAQSEGTDAPPGSLQDSRPNDFKAGGKEVQGTFDF